MLRRKKEREVKKWGTGLCEVKAKGDWCREGGPSSGSRRETKGEEEEMEPI